MFAHNKYPVTSVRRLEDGLYDLHANVSLKVSLDLLLTVKGRRARGRDLARGGHQYINLVNI